MQTDHRAVARVDLSAIERNVARLRRALTAGTAMCAVVKADGYGHGAAMSARAAVAAGAGWIAVVTAGEATAIRAAGVAARLIVLGPLTDGEAREAADAGADVVVSDEDGLGRLERLGRPLCVHVKLDSGMGRLGQPDPEAGLELCDRVAGSARLTLAGAMTHFATADDADDPLFDEQLARFTTWAERVRERHPGVLVHAANSAATLRTPAAHFDLVRCGVAIYGLDPGNRSPDHHDLEPALEWIGRLAAIRTVPPGASVGYGRRFVAVEETRVGTVTVGYADGLRRALSGLAEVRVRGRRARSIGSISMDSFGIDLGGVPDAAVGDAVVLLGGGGAGRLTAEAMAGRLGTINYEITCGIGPRVPRAYHRGGIAGRPS